VVFILRVDIRVGTFKFLHIILRMWETDEYNASQGIVLYTDINSDPFRRKREKETREKVFNNVNIVW
jgi:hypothetical protein